MDPKKIKYLIILLVIIAGMTMPGMVAADQTDLKDIHRPARFDAGRIDYQEITKNNFDVIGTLDAVYEDHIVVGDHAVKLDSADLGGFSVGDFVGAKVNANGKLVKLERLDPKTFNQ